MRNNMSYEEAVKELKKLEASQKRRKDKLKRTLRKDYPIYSVRQSGVAVGKKEINLLLSIIHAHKAARKLYGENLRLQKIFKKVADNKGITGVEFNTEETILIDKLLGSQNWNGQ